MRTVAPICARIARGSANTGCAGAVVCVLHVCMCVCVDVNVDVNGNVNVKVNDHVDVYVSVYTWTSA